MRHAAADMNQLVKALKSRRYFQERELGQRYWPVSANNWIIFFVWHFVWGMPMRKFQSTLASMVVCLGTCCMFAPAHAETYFTLATTAGFINPGVYVGFNPQPDPPALPPTTLSLANASFPLLTFVPPDPCTQDSSCSAGLVMSFSGIGGTLLPAVQMPSLHLVEQAGGPPFFETSFDFSASGHDFSVTLDIFGPTSITNWASFNPQPDPPGDGFGYAFSFIGDPSLGFSILEDRTDLLTFSETPLPATLPLFFSGAGTLGLLGWRRKRRATAVAA
jgi:hypothetical protein